ncbi:MAG: oligosaccharide flippase family protein [Candidatus Omnitrophica bacterium]|nr:oligosaccharide flippase family protein [Candidatus Omnitrophota bacterium]
MRKNFFYYLSPSVLAGILGVFVIIPVSTYYLDPEDFGVVGIITVFSGLIVPLSSVGLSWVLSGNYYKISDEEKKALVFNLLIIGFLFRVFWALVFGIFGHLFLPKAIKSFQPEFIFFFWIFLTAECFNAINQTVTHVIMFQKKGKMHALFDVIKTLSRALTLVFALVVLKLKTVSLALAFLGAAAGGCIYCLFYIRKYVVYRFEARWVKEIIKRGFPTIPLNLFEIISTSIGRFFVERWAGLSELGIYSHSLEYRKAFMVPERAFLKVSAPEFLEAFSNNNKTKSKSAKQALKKWFGLLTLGGVFLVFFSKDALNILTHGKFINAAVLICLWFTVIAVYAFGIPYTRYLLAHKKNKFMFYSELILGFVSIAIIALFVKFFSIVGATAAVLLYYLLLNLTRRIYARKLGCENFERNYFIVTMAILLGLTYLVNTFDLDLAIKLVSIVILSLFVVKFYDLNPLSLLNKKKAGTLC